MGGKHATMDTINITQPWGSPRKKMGGTKQPYNPNQVWEAARARLQVQMNRRDFDTWIRDTVLVAHEDGAFIIGAPNAFTKDWLRNRLHNQVKRALEAAAGQSVEVTYVVEPRRRSEDLRVDDVPLIRNARQEATSIHYEYTEFPPLNPKYTFDTYIVGGGNKMAYAAARAVAEQPGKAYNPLFIYGGVGLGKTHLLHAIGHAVRQQGRRVLYVSSETFTNDLINAIRNKTTDQFRARYRNVDVLLIDDVQFIAGKESTQEEFFHTFNALHAADKQICITSDRPPREIATLEERLRSRFQGGIMVDIRPPDFEMRVAILRNKAEEYPVHVPDEVLAYIAEHVENNIRELVGAFNRVVARAVLIGEPITLAQTRHILEDMMPVQQALSPEAILSAVAAYYHIDPIELKGKSRRRAVARPRQIAMYLLREETDLSLPQIGLLLGGRDHTTVMHGYEKIAKELAHDTTLQRQLEEIRELAQRTPAAVT